MPLKIIHNEGDRFNRLTILCEHSIRKNGVHWLCQCICGKFTVVLGKSLRNGDIKSCGCMKTEMLKQRNLKRCQPGEAAFNRVIGRYKARALELKFEYSLTPDEARSLFEADCYYCGVSPINISSGIVNGEYIYNGIDRKDNNKGYTKTNSVTCCIDCNIRKSDLDYLLFIDWISTVYKRVVMKEDDVKRNKRIVKDIRRLGRKIAGQPKPTLIEQTKKRVSRQEQKIRDKREIE